MEIVWVLSAVQVPTDGVMFNCTVYVPFAVYVWLGPGKVEVPPSPNDQFVLAILNELTKVNGIVVPLQYLPPTGAGKVKLGFGAGFTVSVNVET